MKLGFCIAILSGIPVSYSCVPDCQAEYSRSHIQNFLGFWYPRSSPLRDVSRGETSATQRQKFHTDDVNQCLHDKSHSHGVPNAHLFNFTFLLVDFGKVLCSSANVLHKNSNIDYFIRDSSPLHLIFAAFCLLSVIRKH